MHPLRLVLMAAALGVLYYFLPPLLGATATPVLACLVAAFYLGYAIGETIEFCIDRMRIAKRL